MTNDHPVLAIEGVRFFGEMCASVSHEIKNVLAIINENAGLLQDMVRMNEKGMPLAPERLSRLAESITRQVARSDGIVKGLNQFAHSTDGAMETVDIGELIQFVVHLADRLITMKGKPPLIDAPVGTITVVTNRFFLENLVWGCLCRALDACPPDRTISIRIEKVEKHARIIFYGMEKNAPDDGAGFPSPQASAVADLLGARLIAENEKCEICILLP